MTTTTTTKPVDFSTLESIESAHPAAIAEALAAIESIPEVPRDDFFKAYTHRAFAKFCSIRDEHPFKHADEDEFMKCTRSVRLWYKFESATNWAQVAEAFSSTCDATGMDLIMRMRVQKHYEAHMRATINAAGDFDVIKANINSLRKEYARQNALCMGNLISMIKLVAPDVGTKLEEIVKEQMVAAGTEGGEDAEKENNA